ncbi:cation-translocating P-type ATPase [Candidatus Mycolicibacterium alkanivorans]|uniref:Cation-translocating P-type ATPase n=1 Tax=Candidatus Mycolicibacterium alkanivorans TaxID=2954114 RepID=A0ABS9Z012_9MYCO|nr:cation-translocating P-type ATPase [Candidatus Mycolicibacterium alkanivorans]MCI4676851.1 cation-translocating P-type ATPase [Candidatus Mycolicibacterium alkanivorans]
MSFRPGLPGLGGLIAAPIQLTATAVGLAGGAALLGGSTAVRVGSRALGAVPGARAVGRAAAGMAVEAIGGPPHRRISRRGARRWIEVRGLAGPDAVAIAEEVLAAVRAVPGVTDAVLNRSVARLVVTVAPEGPAENLSDVVADAERRARTEPARRQHPLTLPGDDSVLVARALGAAAATASLGVSLVGTALRLPGVPDLVSVVPTVADHIPAVRHQLVRRLGPEGTDLLFSVANSVTAALTVSPTSAAAEAVARTMLTVEAWNARLAWGRHEELLAQNCPEGGSPAPGTAIFAAGPGEDFANRFGWIGLSAAAVIGALSRNPAITGATALVTAPKPTRATREAFGAAMTCGLTTHHDALVVRPRVLRALDRVDVIVIDPRALYTDELTITRVRGVTNLHRTKAWEAAQFALEDGKLGPGWHKLSSIRGAGRAGEALVSPVRDPFATAVVAEARRAGVRLVSVDDDGLRSLTQGFDTLFPMTGSLDDTLADAVAQAGADGATVALVTTSDMTAAHEAGITIGIMRGAVPPWGADMFVPDLLAVWRILHAMPAARAAGSHGVRLSMSSSAIGALMLIPGVPGNGPESVNAGVLGGLWAGFTAGNKVFGDALPAPEPGHEWYSLPVSEVQRLLPRPASAPRQPSAAPNLLLAPARLAGRAASATWSLAGEFVGEMRTNLADPITPILATGAVASALLGSPLDAALVGGVLLANAALSSEQQLHAERVLRRLLAVQDPLARRRVGPLDEGATEDVAAGTLRPGDVIEIHAGEVVPADARLIEAANVEVDESTLTGESLPVPKQTDPTPGAPLAERSGMVYAGTTMVAGTAVAVVTTVGRSTEIHRAMAMAPTKSRQIGLQRQLAHITSRALPWSLASGAAVGAFSALRGTPLREAVGSAVALMVAAVPEGLPLVATLAQLAAARRLSSEHVLIRNANSVEALARLDVVCFDKTGTLSENRLQVKQVQPVRGHSRDDVVRAALSTVFARNGRADHATDAAVRRAAGPVDASERDAYLPFQSGRPFAAALVGTRLTIKGAPEVLSAALNGDRDRLGPAIERLAAEGLRVLAVAERELTELEAAQAAADPAAMEQLCGSGLTPIGLLGLADTPRPTAAALLADLGARGIGVRLITGDHPVTAAVIANDLGLAVTEEQVITGSEWESMSVGEREQAVVERLVFARMSPEHKIDVVQTLERIGLVTAMVGDGANDAAAIRAASVGIGVAAPGSDPARTAADVMLLDGRIEALLDALDEGEQLWRRVQSAVSMLLGGNAGEVAFALITSLATGRSVLNARQMLLVNMLTDALPAAALAVSNQGGTGTLHRDESAMWRAIAIRGTATTAGATLAWLMGRMTGTQRRAATIALIGLVSTQLAQTLADSRAPLVVSTAAGSFLVLAAVISTPGVSQIFGCTPVDPLGWGQAFLATAVAASLSALAPAVLEWIGSKGYALVAGSVVDDDDAGLDQQGVDLPNRGRQQSNPHHDEGVGSAEAQGFGHNSRQAKSHDLNGSRE